MEKNNRIPRHFNTKEREIIRTIHQEGGGITANEISVETEIAYITVQKYLSKLARQGIVKPNRKVIRKVKGATRSVNVRWSLNYKILKD